jgi:hypothetical protein
VISAKRQEQFWSHVIVGDCWQWAGSVGANGYGRNGFWFGKRYETYAHRIAFRLLTQTEPKELDHLCRNRLCVNPDHLESVTRLVNSRRGVSIFAQHARQTHCLNGHLLSGENVYRYPDGRRECRTCSKQYKAEWHQKQKARVA